MEKKLEDVFNETKRQAQEIRSKKLTEIHEIREQMKRLDAAASERGREIDRIEGLLSNLDSLYSDVKDFVHGPPELVESKPGTVVPYDPKDGLPKRAR